jgi:hypothetical protein
MLGVSSRTVERLKASGDLPFSERGARPRIFFKRADVMAYARGNRRTPDDGESPAAS